MKQHNLVICLLLLFTPTLLISYSNFKTKALSLKLYEDRYWLKLLHFENHKSIINNKEFFLSMHGHIDAKAEMMKTLEQFSLDKKNICKYPARYNWLDSKLDFRKDLQDMQCPKLEKFLAPAFDKLSVVFTSERYDSPASVFGHTFLKLDSKTIPYAINYVAEVPENENRFIYAYKGLTGKYPSSYKFVPFMRKDYEYRAQEFRDLLQFEIAFNKQQIKNILLHLYEIQNTTQNYYFMGRNCSSELIRLIDMADYKSTLSHELSNTTIPIDIVYLLNEKKMISSSSIQASKLKLFYKYQKKLNEKSKQYLLKIINHQISIKVFDEDTTLSLENKKLIILTSIAYIEMISTNKNFENKHIYSLLKLIDLSLKYNLQSKFNEIEMVKKNPISNKFHKLSLGTKHTLNNKKQLQFQYRHLYRNRFDLMDAMKKNGTVEMFDITLRVIENKISLEKFNLINLEAMPLSNDFFTNSTSKIQIGAQRLFYDDSLYSFATFAMGYKYALTKRLDYNFATTLGSYYHNEDLYKVSFENSFEYFYKNQFIGELKFELSTFSNGIESQNISFNNYLKLDTNKTFNLSLSHNNDLKKYTNITLNYTFMF